MHHCYDIIKYTLIILSIFYIINICIIRKVINMKTSYLKSFIEVINLKSISKAAEKLYISQPAVSKQIQSLEKEFGFSLLIRKGKNIKPTKEGKKLYKDIVNLLNLEDEILNKYNKNNLKNCNKNLLIYSSSLPANYLLSNYLHEFSSLYPNINYTIESNDSKKVYDSISEGFTSFGFTGTKHQKKNIFEIPIFIDNLILVAPSTDYYRKFKNRTIEFTEILNENFILREKGSATLKTFSSEIEKIGFNIKNLNTHVIVKDIELTKRLIDKGFGISVLSKLSVENDLESGKFIELDVKNLNIKREIYYVYHKKRYFSYVENLFKDFMLNKVIR